MTCLTLCRLVLFKCYFCSHFETSPLESYFLLTIHLSTPCTLYLIPMLLPTCSSPFFLLLSNFTPRCITSSYLISSTPFSPTELYFPRLCCSVLYRSSSWRFLSFGRTAETTCTPKWPGNTSGWYPLGTKSGTSYTPWRKGTDIFHFFIDRCYLFISNVVDICSGQY